MEETPTVIDQSIQIQENLKGWVPQLFQKLKKALNSCGINAKEAFQMIDINNTGKIRAEDFNDCLGKMNIVLTTEQFQDLKNFFDRIGNGEISQDQFVSILRSCQGLDDKSD